MKPGLLFLAFAFALIPAFIAKSKGRSFAGWFVFGFFLWLVALIASLVIEERKPCPFCNEKIKIDAAYCSSCGRPLPVRAFSEDEFQPTLGMSPKLKEELRRRQRK